MKKILLLLITLITLTNVSYASFPVSDTLKVKQDTVQTETVEQYHLRMQKMGFDLSNCNCQSCRSEIPIPAEIQINSIQKKGTGIFFTLGLLTLILLIALLLWINRGVKCANNRADCRN